MAERIRRIGLNEAAFRAVNEQIESLSRRFNLRSDALEFVCECGNAGCAERVTLGHDDYLAVREDSRRFFVVPGHELPEMEDVVERGETFYVVEKREGEPAEVARSTDVS